MIKSLLLTALLSATSVASVLADTVTLSGNTLGGATFVRPTETGARSFFTVPYNVYQFNVTTTGQFSFTLNAANPAVYDTFLHLFVNAFNPLDLSDPALNFLAANDDLNPSNSALGSALSSVTLSAGTTYFFVVDGFLSSDAGAYTATISGPGAVNVVPEPSTIAFLAISALGLACVIRVRSRAGRV